MSDEEVIRRRLLVDGDGTGDDRRLNILLKTMLKWCNTKDTPEESRATHDKMLAQLAQCEYAVTKSQLAAEMTALELHHYESMSATIESGVVQARSHIERSKEELRLAKIIRRNRMQYDSLARIIAEQPDRRETQERLDKLRTEIDTLNRKRKALQESLDERKKEFNVFVTSMHQLLAMLDNSSPTSDNDLSLEGFEDTIDMDRYNDDPDDTKMEH